ncbi:RNA polymerase II holoenzyme cyclin-like subunit [Pseudocyphellaria aurata]|nr:RNA polymerase II holoenzyme cyclin-like subunit [Pseudocyphellaria aurata]
MAANYWASTQRRHWQFSREALLDIRQRLEDEDRNLVQQYPLPDRRHLSFFFNGRGCLPRPAKSVMLTVKYEELAKLGKRIVVRQQALATAQVYVRRFYSKVEIRHTNPYLMLATALYLACKMEECPQHIRVVVTEARNIWPGLYAIFPLLLITPNILSDYIISDVSKLGECEFSLISEMNSQLIVHHPYRTLQELQGTLSMAQEDVSLAWSILNDHYLTDLPLLFPPHVIAVTAIFLALTLKPTQAGLQAAASTAAALANASQVPKETSSTGAMPNSPQVKVQNLVSWLAEGEVDIKAVVDCSQEIISLYDVLEQYSEKTCKEQIARFVKARGLDK